MTFGPRPHERLAIQHVNVVPMSVPGVRPDQTLVLRDGFIEWIGPSAEAPPAERIVRAQGKFVMPGLADMHVHFWDPADYPLYLANGVTAIRNMWGAPMHLAMRRLVNEGHFPGPRIYTTSPIVDGPGPKGRPIWPNSTLVRSAEDARRAVEGFAARGYDQLKVYSWLDPDTHASLCAAAERVGMVVTGHCPDALTFEEAIGAGQRCFEHLQAIRNGHLEAGVVMPDPRDQRNRLALARLMAEHLDLDAIRRLAADMAGGEIWNCPTVTVWQQMDKRGAEARTDPAVRYVAPATVATWDPTQDFRFRDVPHTSEEYRDARRRQNERYIDIVRVLHEEGSPLLLGTDTPNPWVVPGFSIHQELANMRAAGLSSYEALATATVQPARFLGEAGKWGVIEQGARADLVLLDGDPLEDLAALRRVSAVFVNGFVFERADLDALLEARAASFAQDPSFDTGLEAPPEGVEVLREGRLRETVAGAIAGELSFRHTRIADGETFVQERYANAPGRGARVLRTTKLHLDRSGGIRSASQVARTVLGEERVHVSPTRDGYRVMVAEVDGHVVEQRIDQRAIASERLAPTALALALPAYGGEMRALSIDLGEPTLVNVSVTASDAAAGRYTVALDRTSDVTQQSYVIGPDGDIATVSEQGSRGDRELTRAT